MAHHGKAAAKAGAAVAAGGPVPHVTQADIAAQLRMLNGTLAHSSPINMGEMNTFTRSTRVPEKRRAGAATTGRIHGIDPLYHDPDVTRAITELTMAESGLAPKAAASETKAEHGATSRQTLRSKPHAKDHVAYMHAFKPLQPPKSAAQEAFQYGDEMAQELAGREKEHCLRRDDFRDYVEASAKYKLLTDAKF